METLDFSIHPCQSKFTFGKVKANENFTEFISVFQRSLNPQ
jgi:hypothetical protein